MGHGTAFAAFEFEDLVRAILHRGKYGGDRGALRAIAALASQRLDGLPHAPLDAVREAPEPINAPLDVLREARQAPINAPLASPHNTIAAARVAQHHARRRASSPGSPLPTIAAARRTPPPPDAIVAVPLGPRRRRQRGYNQSDILARVLAELQRARMLAGLERIRETTAQSVRDEHGRRRNVAGAFAWKGSPLAGARLWLVDDVLTTGFTVEAAGEALSAAGASRVDVVIVAVVP
jgi:predicted amidophosphoribosyltransferase